MTHVGEKRGLRGIGSLRFIARGFEFQLKFLAFGDIVAGSLDKKLIVCIIPTLDADADVTHLASGEKHAMVGLDNFRLFNVAKRGYEAGAVRSRDPPQNRA